MRVRDAMTTDVLTVGPDTPLGDLVRLLAERRVSGAPVVNDHGALVGIVSESDVLRQLRTHLTRQTEFVLPTPFDLIEYPLRAALQRRDLEQTVEDARSVRVADVMSKNVAVADPDEGLTDASQRMLVEEINRVPVIEDGRLVGILTRGDVIRALAKQASEGGRAAAEGARPRNA